MAFVKRYDVPLVFEKKTPLQFVFFCFLHRTWKGGVLCRSVTEHRTYQWNGCSSVWSHSDQRRLSLRRKDWILHCTDQRHLPVHRHSVGSRSPEGQRTCSLRVWDIPPAQTFSWTFSPDHHHLNVNTFFLVFTGMTRKILSVCPSVRPSVCLSVTRVYCDKTVERSVQIYIPYERTFIPLFWEEEWLVGGDPFYTWNFGSTDPRLNEIADFQPIIARSSSAVTPSEKKFN